MSVLFSMNKAPTPITHTALLHRLSIFDCPLLCWLGQRIGKLSEDTLRWFSRNSRVLFCICVHFRLPPTVHGPSGSRAPARRLTRFPVASSCNGRRENVSRAGSRWSARKGLSRTKMKWITHYGRPHIDIDIRSHRPISDIIEWMRKNNIRMLNVAGNREPKSGTALASGITAFVIDYLSQVFCRLGHRDVTAGNAELDANLLRRARWGQRPFAEARQPRANGDNNHWHRTSDAGSDLCRQRISNHRPSRWYEEGSFKGPLRYSRFNSPWSRHCWSFSWSRMYRRIWSSRSLSEYSTPKPTSL